MGEFSIWHWLIVLCVVLLLFGGNKMSSLMGDFAKGIKAFKKNMADDSDHAAPASLEAPGPVESAAPREHEHVPG
jgi:sec-independent protein translocase protein TatA